MSVTVAQAGALATKKVKLSTTAATTIYQAEDGLAAVILEINIANTDAASTRQVTVDIWDGTTAYEIIKSADIAIKARLSVTDIAVALLPGESLRATASNANTLVVIATVMEAQRFSGR